MQYFKSFFAKTLTLIFINFASQHIMTQAQSTIKGTVLDTTDRKILVYATIKLLRAKDSALISSVRTNKEGQFSCSKIKRDNLS